MRLLNKSFLFAIVASSLATAALPSALFYTFPENAHQTTVALSQVDVRLALASRLGVSRYHSLGAESSLFQVEQINGKQKGSLWLDQYDRQGSVIITISSVADPKSILPKKSPAIELKDQPTSSSFGELLTNLKTQKEQLTGHEGLTVYENPLGSFITVISPTGGSDVHLRSANSDDWKQFESTVGSDNAAVFDKDAASDMNFAQEYVALASLLGYEMEKVIAERSTVIGQLVSMESIYKNYGVSSKEYKTATALVSKLVGEFAGKGPKYQTVLAFLAPSTRVAKRDFVGSAVKFEKRREIPVAVESHEAEESQQEQQPAATTSKAKATGLPLQKYSECFTTGDLCRQVTANCSGRGECFQSKVEKHCWSCKCEPTLNRNKDGKVIGKTYWGGSACQKRDISVPFWLLFGFTIGMLSVLYFAIGQMMSMGSEELPGVLSAGVSGVKRSS